MIPTMLAAPQIVRAEEHIDDYAGHCRKDSEGREPDDGDESERLCESLAGADAGGVSGDKPRKGHCHERSGQEKAMWPAIAAAA